MNLDCLIGIGGGSTIDFAKGLATLLKNKGKALNYRGFPQKINRSIPVIAVPSTTGTGAEVAYNAVFTDLKSKRKLGINTKNNYPILSVLDPTSFLRRKWTSTFGWRSSMSFRSMS